MKYIIDNSSQSTLLPLPHQTKEEKKNSLERAMPCFNNYAVKALN